MYATSDDNLNGYSLFIIRWLPWLDLNPIIDLDFDVTVNKYNIVENVMKNIDIFGCESNWKLYKWIQIKTFKHDIMFANMTTKTSFCFMGCNALSW